MAPYALLGDAAEGPNDAYASLPDVMLTMFTWGAFGAFDVEELQFAIAPTFMIIIFCVFMLVRAAIRSPWRPAAERARGDARNPLDHPLPRRL